MRPSSRSLPPGRSAVHRHRTLLLALPAALLGLLGLLTLAAPTRAGQAGPIHTAALGEALGPSNPDQLAVVEHLRLIGALFYGAWWCPACFRQKSLFGQQAGERLPYVECDKTSEGRERCSAAGIEAYPTWVLGTKRLEGVQTLEELKRWSGFSSAPSQSSGSGTGTSRTTP